MEKHMRATTPLLSFAVLAATAVLALPAQAAPAAATRDAVARDAVSGVEPVAYRRCWWDDGRRRCRWVEGRRGYRTYGYGVGEGRPEDYRYGSTEWWRAMDREGRGGFRR
jgi:hypothetical protein